MSEQGLGEELIARLQAGDEHAFSELIVVYRDKLKQMLQFRMDHRLRGRADSSDILQEVCIDAHQRIRHYLKRPELSFYIWLRQLTAQRLIDVHRRHLLAERRDVKQEISISQPVGVGGTSVQIAEQLVGQLTSPSQAVIREEMLAQLEKALNQMDPIDREVLALRHFEELGNGEVAEVLGIKVSTASNRYVRALSRLRTTLEALPGFFPGI
jgi:RNA polymerase sigma-70 factor (ECF subfamily)